MRRNLPILIDQLISRLSRMKQEYEIILVNDGSNDKFSSKLKVKSTMPTGRQEKLKVISHRKRLGKGTW